MSAKNPLSFNDILNDASFDPAGLLDSVIAESPKRSLNDPKIRTAFQEIVDFRSKTGRIPDLEATSIREKLLAARLSAYRTNPVNAVQVKDLDIFGLLTVSLQPINTEKKNEAASCSSLDEILNSTDSLLSDIDPSILRMEHVSTQKNDTREIPDKIGKRKPCREFFRFEKLFKDTLEGIKSKRIKTEKFKKESQVEVGDFFILGGLMCLVDAVLEETREKDERANPRLRVIFENGIELDCLKRSLTSGLYRDQNGRRIIPDADKVTDQMQGITHRDKATGCIYILSSETKAPALAELRSQGRLVKIGFSTQSVEERVKNAERDPTYLEAPVKILASLDCYNLDPHKVEHLIHAFLAKQRLNMTLISSKGLPYRPTEWFAVDRDTAIAVAEHVVKGDIMDYRMDNTTNRIKRR